MNIIHFITVHGILYIQIRCSSDVNIHSDIKFSNYLARKTYCIYFCLFSVDEYEDMNKKQLMNAIVRLEKVLWHFQLIFINDILNNYVTEK